MKYLSTILTLILIPSLSWGQTDCRPYLPVNKGATWEITDYNAKGKENGKIVYELIDKVESGSEITFTIRNTSYDKKGKEIFTNSFKAKCIGEKFEIDMAFKMDGAAMQSYQNMEFDLDASEFELPNLDAPSGTKLKDGNLKVALMGNSPIGLNMTVFITDRVIEGREDLKTPAGSFDCVIMSQKVSTKVVMKIESTSKEWYAENVGMVRSESYNKNGKLLGYSELTKLDRK